MRLSYQTMPMKWSKFDIYSSNKKMVQMIYLPEECFNITLTRRLTTMSPIVFSVRITMKKKYQFGKVKNKNIHLSKFINSISNYIFNNPF